MTVAMGCGMRVMGVSALVVGLTAPAAAQKGRVVAAPYVPPAGTWERRSPSTMGGHAVLGTRAASSLRHS